MYKDIKQHYALVTSALENDTPTERRKLYAYHIDRLRDFQHERLVHLFVTLFFGALVVTGVIALFMVGVAGMSGMIMALLSFMVALLLVVELCYIWYYYLLENGVQRLSRLTHDLFEMQ